MGGHAAAALHFGAASGDAGHRDLGRRQRASCQGVPVDPGAVPAALETHLGDVASIPEQHRQIVKACRDILVDVERHLDVPILGQPAPLSTVGEADVAAARFRLAAAIAERDDDPGSPVRSSERAGSTSTPSPGCSPRLMQRRRRPATRATFPRPPATDGWGRKVIDRLSCDLRREFPEMRGLSRPTSTPCAASPPPGRLRGSPTSCGEIAVGPRPRVPRQAR